MKISKIPGLGRFGVFIDDIDLFNISDEEWFEIHKLHLEQFVVILRNTNLTIERYQELMFKIGVERNCPTLDWIQKYGPNYYQRAMADDPAIEHMDMLALKELGYIAEQKTLRVSGKKDKDGNRLGMFSEGELLWHSNESGRIHFTPGVSLLGGEHMIGSSTGFLTTPDYYENVSNAFRSELDEMIILHRFTPGKISPGVGLEQDAIVYNNMCPVPDNEIPLVINSPGGTRGLHYSVNTCYSIKGMTKEESDAVFEEINKELFVDKYIYDHWYQSDSDLCLFENSITLHRRLGDIKDRMCYRIQYDQTPIAGFYQPYIQPEYQEKYLAEIKKHNLFSEYLTRT